MQQNSGWAKGPAYAAGRMATAAATVNDQFSANAQLAAPINAKAPARSATRITHYHQHNGNHGRDDRSEGGDEYVDDDEEQPPPNPEDSDGDSEGSAPGYAEARRSARRSAAADRAAAARSITKIIRRRGDPADLTIDLTTTSSTG